MTIHWGFEECAVALLITWKTPDSSAYLQMQMSLRLSSGFVYNRKTKRLWMASLNITLENKMFMRFNTNGSSWVSVKVGHVRFLHLTPRKYKRFSQKYKRLFQQI